MKTMTSAKIVAVRVVAQMVAAQTMANPRTEPFSDGQIEAFWYMAHDRAVREVGGKPDPDSADEVDRVGSIVSDVMLRICDPMG